MRTLIFGGNSDIAKAVGRITDSHLVDMSECDVRIPSQVYDTINKYRPDYVVNCAGISRVQTIKGSLLHNWRDEIETNLVGAYYIAKYAVELGVKAQVHIASVAGKYGKPNHSGYCASKAGLISLVQSLGMEGYAAYAISPGRVDTKMRQNDYPNDPPGTRLSTDQVAKVVVECLEGRYQPGDNIVYRKRGTRVLRRIDKGSPWKNYLNVRPL